MGGLVTEREKVGSGGDLDRAVADLKALSGDMASCAVLSADGVLLSSSHEEGVDRERAAAMLAAAGTLAATTAKDARVGLVLYDMRNARAEIGAATNAGGRS